MTLAIFNLSGNIPRAKQDLKRRARGCARISAAKFWEYVGMLSKPQDLDEDSERTILSISGGCGELETWKKSRLPIMFFH